MNLKNTPWKIIYFLCLLDATAFAAKVNNKFFPLKRDTSYSYPLWPKNDLLQIKTSDYGEMWESKGIILDAIKGKENEFVRIKEVPFYWDEVMDKYDANTLEPFLQNFSGTIKHVYNYNPFNALLKLEDISAEKIEILLPWMIKRGANINQEEKKIKIIPVCKDCKKAKHQKDQCKLINNNDKNDDKKNKEIHDIYVNEMTEGVRGIIERSTNASNARAFDIYNKPLWAIIEYYSNESKKWYFWKEPKINLASLMKLFIDNKAEINSENILVACTGDFLEEKYINSVESLLEFAIFQEVPPDVIKLLASKGAEIYRNNECNSVKIDNQTFVIRTTRDYFFLFNKLSYLNRTEKDQLIKELIEENGERWRDLPGLPVWIDSSVQNQLLWFEKAIINKIDRKITKDDIQNVCNGACSIAKDEKTEDIIKVLNCFLKILYPTNPALLKLFIKKAVAESIKPAYLPKTIIEKIVEYCIPVKEKELVEMITGMTTVKPYLRPNQRISLYEANIAHRYKKDLKHFFSGKNPVHNTNKEEFIKENEEHWEDLLELPDWIKRAMEGRQDMRNDQDIDELKIKDVCLAAFSNSMKDKGIDNIIKGLNFFLKILLDQKYSTALSKKSDISGIEKNLPKEKLYEIEKKELVAMIKGMTTVKTYLRPNTIISLYKANRKYDYDTDLENFFNRYL